MKNILFSIIFLLSSTLVGQHTIVLKSGEKIDGIVLSLSEDVWTVFIDGNEKQIEMKQVSSIFFNEFVPYDGVLQTDGEEATIMVDGFEVSYQVKDRKLVQEPKVSIGSEDKGTVVVKVVIDRYGNILSAEPGQPGSTTSNNYLNTKAKIAAKTAKFDENLKGPLKTEGLIKITY